MEIIFLCLPVVCLNYHKFWAWILHDQWEICFLFSRVNSFERSKICRMEHGGWCGWVFLFEPLAFAEIPSATPAESIETQTQMNAKMSPTNHHVKFIICQLSHLVNNEKFDRLKTRCSFSFNMEIFSITFRLFAFCNRTWKSFA